MRRECHPRPAVACGSPPERISNVQFLVACANRMHGIPFPIFPDVEAPFSSPTGATPLALMRQELGLPKNLCAISPQELAPWIHPASRGRFGREKAEPIQQRAHTTFAVESADTAHSFGLKPLAEVYQHIQKVTLKALRAKIQACLKPLPFEHQLATIPYVGDLVRGTFLSE